jgi:antibiotic biosynthesis monooxygenase (ABM) superfamily enzyme
MGFWFNMPSIKRNAVWIVVYMLCMLYAVSSINVLILAMGVLPYIKGFYMVTRTLIYFAIISFGLTIFLSVHHIYTMLRTEKRKNINLEEISQL